MSDPQKYVTPKVAQPIWVKHAYEILVDTAGTYNAVITYSELAEELQRRSGLATTSQMHHWIGALLEDVSKVNHVRQEPALTSLVVRKDDGQVGVGYGAVLRLWGQEPIDDQLERETHAAAVRLECYRRWGAEVPSNAVPTLSPRMREVRDRTTRTPPTEERRGAVCPTCFMEMPVAGSCSNCG
ncbi:MAG: hypothetical protein ABI112_07320 [Terracoccus sp.]